MVHVPSWFALDRDGHVGRFASDVDGPVPKRAVSDPSVASAILEVGRRDPRAPLYDREGFAARTGETHARIAYRGWPGAWIVFLDRVPHPLPAGREVRAASGAAIVLPEGTLTSVFDGEGLCRGCYPFEPLESDPHADPEELDWSVVGVFDYEDDDGDDDVWHPYSRTTRPEKPLRVDDLPPHVAAKLAECRLDVSFLDRPRVQPIDHVPCDVEEGPPAYETSDAKLAPVPGREAEFEAWKKRAFEDDPFAEQRAPLVDGYRGARSPRSRDDDEDEDEEPKAANPMRLALYVIVGLLLFMAARAFLAK